eukprot:Opistho-2@80950
MAARAAVAVLAVLAAITTMSGAFASLTPRTPVILLTDIGTDIDDTWALAVLMQSSAYDIVLIVAESHNTPARAKVAAKFLEGTGRDSIPIALGIQQDETDSYLYGWAADYDLSTYKAGVVVDGVNALLNAIKQSTVPPVLVVLSPCPTLLAAYRQEPNTVALVRTVYAMMGSVRRGYKGASHPDSEYNVYDNVAAAAMLFDGASSGIYNLTVTPLDTCGIFQIDGESYDRFLRAAASTSAIAKLILESYVYWQPLVPWCTPEAPQPCEPHVRSSVIYDVVAIGMMEGFRSRKHLGFEQLAIDIVGNMTVIAPSGVPSTVATFWLSEKDVSHHSLSLTNFGDDVIECIISGC